MAADIVGLMRILVGDRSLDAYLNDHLAGSTFGTDLARRIAERTDEPRMHTVAEEIAEDRRTLLALMERLDVSRSSVKAAGTWAAARLARLKLSGLTAGDGAFGRYLDLEALSLGVAGKMALWTALMQMRDRLPQLRDFDLEMLHSRAVGQREVIESLRLERAALGFG